jgi:DNA adenine methylase
LSATTARTLFSTLDPPCYGIKGYRLNFEPKDFEELAQALACIKGKFLMSLNDHKEVRRIFSGFKIEPVSLRYSCMRKINSAAAPPAASC